MFIYTYMYVCEYTITYNFEYKSFEIDINFCSEWI